MHRFQPFQPDHPVKLFQYTIQILNNIISCVIYMTSIQADAHFFLQFHPFQNSCQFFKPASHLRTFSRHGFQKDCGTLSGLQDSVQHISNLLDSFFYSLSHMTSRMKVVAVSRHIFHTLQVILHSLKGKFPYMLIRRAGI